MKAGERRIASAKVLDKAYEYIKESGKSLSEIGRTNPQLLADRFCDIELLQRRASEAAARFDELLWEYTLLENGAMIFRKLKRGEERRIGELEELREKHEGDESMQDLISYREKGVRDGYKRRFEETGDELEKWEIRYGRRDSQGYLRMFLKDLVDAASRATDRIGKHGRLYLYQQMVFQLMKKETRSLYPNSMLIRTLAVKDMLLNEEDTFIRLAVLKVTGVGVRKYFHAEELLMFDAAREGS